MCVDCAIGVAVAFVWGQDRSRAKQTAEYSAKCRTGFCSEACRDALHEFMIDTLGCELPTKVSPDQLPWRAH